MLDEIESLYDKDAMADIMQIMVYSKECPHCQRSLPVWKKLGWALSRRLRNYHHAFMEINDSIDVDGKKLSGANLYTAYKEHVNGVPFFIQNFEAKDLIKNKSIRIKELSPVFFHVVSVGELQPFQFLASTFGVKNLFIESKIANSLNAGTM
jgi:hypothetical protein